VFLSWRAMVTKGSAVRGAASGGTGGRGPGRPAKTPEGHWATVRARSRPGSARAARRHAPPSRARAGAAIPGAGIRARASRRPRLLSEPEARVSPGWSCSIVGGQVRREVETLVSFRRAFRVVPAALPWPGPCPGSHLWAGRERDERARPRWLLRGNRHCDPSGGIWVGGCPVRAPDTPYWISWIVPSRRERASVMCCAATPSDRSMAACRLRPTLRRLLSTLSSSFRPLCARSAAAAWSRWIRSSRWRARPRRQDRGGDVGIDRGRADPAPLGRHRPPQPCSP